MSLHLIVLHYIMPYSSSLFMCLSPALPLPPFFFFVFGNISFWSNFFIFAVPSNLFLYL